MKYTKKCQMKLKLALFFSFFIIFYSFSNENPSNYYNIATKYEEEGDFVNALKYYKKYIELLKDDIQTEKIQLKIARLTEDYDLSIIEYNKFLKNYPLSRYRFLARFEMAGLHQINKNYLLALEEYNKLINQSKGTSYWQKSLICSAQVQYLIGDSKSAIKNLYKVLNEIDDYEDIGLCYFLLGVIMEKQKQYEDAKEFFLICAGSFPQSTKAPASLLELMKMYVKLSNLSKAKKIAKMINQLYTDSPENYEASKISKELEDIKESLEDIELINLNENQEIKQKSLARLKEDLKLSLDIENNTIVDNKKSGFFVQLGFYSIEENAKQLLEICKEKGINEVYIFKTNSSKTDKLFYRVLIGPFGNSSLANEKLIDLKEKNIEAIVLELGNNER